MKLRENERIDDLEYKNLKIIQNEKGFCFGIDSVLISDFAKEIKNNSIGVDLGSGTGIISILLTVKTNLSKIIGIEIQKDVADMSKRSVELNNLQEKIEIININLKNIEKMANENKINNNEVSEGNINKKNLELEVDEKLLDKENPLLNKKTIYHKLQRESFDFVVTNPPYKKLKTGKSNENEYKYLSRHEVTANLEDFIKVSKYLLRDRGAFYMVHRPDRLVDIIELMRRYKLEPKKIRFVYSTIEKEPILVLIKGVKNAKDFLKTEKPLVIYNTNGEYTEEIYKIYNKDRRKGEKLY